MLYDKQPKESLNLKKLEVFFLMQMPLNGKYGIRDIHRLCCMLTAMQYTVFAVLGILFLISYYITYEQSHV